jgi:hypothetical protein
VLLEPKVMVDPKTLLVALVFTIAVLGGKALAAVVAGRVFKFSWPEVGVMSGLSGSQAAATLATTLVGAKLGLFDTTTINAVLVVILASLVITPLMVTAFGKHVPTAAGEKAAFAKTVLVPVWGESSRAAVRLAGRLAVSEGGIVVAASFATKEAAPPEVKSQRMLAGQAEEWLAKDGLESRTTFRVAQSIPEGLLETVLGEDATMLVTEWRMRETLEPDSEASEALARTPVPVLIAHGDVDNFERAVIVARRDALVRPGLQDVELAAQLAARFAHHRRLAVVAPGFEHVKPLFDPKRTVDLIEAADPIDWLKQSLQMTDLPLFAGLEAARDAMARVPTLIGGRFLVAIAAEETTFHKREERIASPVGMARTLKPHPA